MPVNEFSTCPECAGPLRGLGKLPDVGLFAGRSVEPPIPGGWLVRCSGCWLTMRLPRGDAAALAKAYDNESTLAWAAEGEARPDWALVRQAIGAAQKPARRVLDVGCYTGGLLATLPEGTQRFGVEPNTNAAAHAAAFGVRVWPSLEEVPAGERFDVITAVDVIEHVYSPALFLDRLVQLLNEDGIVVVSSGDADNFFARCFGANWWYWFYPEHVSFVSRRWLRRHCAEHGLKLRVAETFAYAAPRPFSKSRDFLQMIAYGFLGQTYLSALRRVNRLRHQDWPVFPKGAGVSRDHLLFVISR